MVSPFKDTTRIIKQGSVPDNKMGTVTDPLTVNSHHTRYAPDTILDMPSDKRTSQTLNASAEGQFSPGQVGQSYEYQPNVNTMNIAVNSSIPNSPETSNSHFNATHKTRLNPD